MPPDSKKLRLGIIGCGAVAELYYAAALKEIESLGTISVDVLCDPVNENVNRLAKIFPNAKTIEKFSNQSLDLLIVASPPFLHAEQTVAALRSGASVLCEKPMSISVSQCQTMNASARENRRPLAIGLIRRFFPASQLIKKIITSNDFGAVKSFRFSEGSPFSWPTKSSSFFDKSQAGGGVLLDTGSHVLDLLLWWFGPAEQVEYEDDAMGGVEVNCRLRLKYADGSQGTVRLSRDCQLKNECYIEFERGWLRWNLSDINTIELCIDQESLILDGKIVEHKAKAGVLHTASTPLTLAQTFVAQINNVLATIAGKDKLMVSGEAAAKSVELIETCYGKRRLIAMPWLTADESVRAHSLGSENLTC